LISEQKFSSPGKLLITGEYLVLEGATALAVPTRFGQTLEVQCLDEPKLVWEAFKNTYGCWLKAEFSLPKLRLENATFDSADEGPSEFIAERLSKLLLEARKLNPDFLNSEKGYLVQTRLGFPHDWGLGSSSTLINNLAQWAQVDAFTLLQNTFGGSGYDVAVAQYEQPILYKLMAGKPEVATVDFNPPFKDQVYFVHLNKKQNSQAGIANFRKKNVAEIKDEVSKVSEISETLITENSLENFEKALLQHEQIISKLIDLPTVQEKLFSDYYGQTKSLGAWGGDFILATGDENTPKYFKNKGFEVVLKYKEMLINIGI